MVSSPPIWAIAVGLPLKTIWTLQVVQNAAAQVVIGVCQLPHVTPLLHKLRWLPVDFWVQFQRLAGTYKALHGVGWAVCRNAGLQVLGLIPRGLAG